MVLRGERTARQTASSCTIAAAPPPPPYRSSRIRPPPSETCGSNGGGHTVISRRPYQQRGPYCAPAGHRAHRLPPSDKNIICS